MDILNSYRIDLKRMKSDSQEFWFHLNHAFFEAVKGPEITDGDMEVHLLVRRTSGAFEFRFGMKGTIQIVCDRCLDMMSLPIETESLVKIRFGEEFDDDGEWITIPEEDDFFDFSWLLYELIALEIPLQHMHEPGACNESMISALETHCATERGAGDDDSESEEQEAERPMDPRWNELKKILDNN